MTPILQRHAKRILACGYKNSLFRSYATLWSPEASQTLLIRIKVAFLPTQPVLDQWQQQEKQLYIGGGLIKNLRDSNPFSQELKTVLGLEEAEKFFKSIPSNMRDYSVYSTLLTSYTRSDNVKPDIVTANTVLKVDVKAIKMFMRTLVEGIKLQRDTIFEMAKVYVRLGSAREVLQTLWDDFKKSEEVYRTAFSSLSKLDDVEEAEDIYGEWKEDERDISEQQVTKKSMMLVMLTHISITRLLRFIFFSEKE
ncbi:hypothetical protein ARALYDRAFT_311587 [Arabidopsis lyrata subsp. lyrata]|uniref:Uncharacterized protein n=1 Tax=Arabidopsis lyrata subsp. lyrata TaxID=81972 RepID=D7KEA2_ARALL|nr:hypothetical protein ARALYDRAFT_311587 [Arabidopsis lyrata subsp. lyrata]